MNQHNIREQEKQGKLLTDRSWDERNKSVEKAAGKFQEYIAAGPKQKKKRPKRLFVIALITIFLAAILLAVYWFVIKENAKSSRPIESKRSAKQAEPSGSISTETKQYTSPNFNLSLKYPANWKVTDTAGSNVLIVESPSLLLTSVTGQKSDGIIRLQIQNKNYPITGFEKGNALAALPSELIKYINPTQMQRAETHLSFLTYAPATSGINALYITGDYGYQANQAIPQLDISTGDPIVSVRFLQCNDEICTKPISIAINTASWDDPAFSAPIKNMLTSLSIN